MANIGYKINSNNKVSFQFLYINTSSIEEVYRDAMLADIDGMVDPSF
jgi:hypothetical protein